jgi:phospholipase C
VRPSLPLPYELGANGRLNVQRTRFEIVLEAGNEAFGKAAAGAPFHVYTVGSFRGQANLRARAYAVSAGDRLGDSWELEAFDERTYRIRVCGPNGFLREFAGAAEDPELEIQCTYAKQDQALTGNVELEVTNRAGQAWTLQIKDHGYKTGDRILVAEPGRKHRLVLTLEQSHHWYDFSVTIAGVSPFLRRFAGRVETGKSGFSDPAMAEFVL